MRRSLRTFALIGFFAADVAGMYVVLRDPDPGYRLASWFAFGKHNKFNEQIANAAALESLDPTLVKSIVWRVSGFSSGKIGPSNERGLMQIGEKYGHDWAAVSGAQTFMQSDLLNPETNLRAGCWYLRKIMDRWSNCDDPVPFALAEYAAGHEAVKAWASSGNTAAQLLQSIDDAPTRAFVHDVMNRRDYYEKDRSRRLEGVSVF